MDLHLRQPLIRIECVVSPILNSGNFNFAEVAKLPAISLPNRSARSLAVCSDRLSPRPFVDRFVPNDGAAAPGSDKPFTKPHRSLPVLNIHQQTMHRQPSAEPPPPGGNHTVRLSTQSTSTPYAAHPHEKSLGRLQTNHTMLIYSLSTRSYPVKMQNPKKKGVPPGGAAVGGFAGLISAPRIDVLRSLANRPKNSVRFSGNFARSTPSARNASVSFSIVDLPTWQSVWPMIMISLPPSTRRRVPVASHRTHRLE